MSAPSDVLPPTRAIVLTDGKIGDLVQCFGVADALGLEPESRVVRPRAAFALFAPRGPVDPREKPGAPGGPLPEPYPDLVLASGRRAIPYLRALKKATGGAVFTSVFKDPRTGPGTADLIWVAEHDRLRGDNVVVTLTAPHRVSPSRLAQARATPDPRLAGLAHPRVGVLVGGDNKHHRWDEADRDEFVGHLRTLVREDGVRLMITVSRRTPPHLAEALGGLAAETGSFFWNGEDGENPYFAILALSDAVVATADSTNMLGEAAASGVPVLVFAPSRGHGRFDVMIEGLVGRGIAHPFRGRLIGSRYEPLDSTPVVAAALARAYRAHRAARGLPQTALGGVADKLGE